MTKTAERGFGIMKAISEIFSSANELIGRENELYAEEIASELSKKGLIPHIKGQLPYLTIPRSEEDYAGYDLMVPTDLGEIGLQIKSSEYGKKLFIERFLTRDYLPYIACVVVNRHRSRAKVTEAIRRTCWREYYSLQKKLGIKTTL